MLYQLLKTTHSLTAYIVLVVLCFAVINAALGVWQKRKYEKKDLRINLFALIFTHLQVTLGLILYFVTPLFQSSAYSCWSVIVYPLPRNRTKNTLESITKNHYKLRISHTTRNTLITNNYALTLQNLLFGIAKA